jgi:CHAT domain-containing protein
VIPEYPNPDLVLPATKLEAKFLQQELNATAVVPHINSVRTLLSQPGAFDLLHFAGHGQTNSQDIFSAQILLQGRMESVTHADGSLDPPNYVPEFLSAITVDSHANLGSPNSTRPIVCLNACQAGRLAYELTGIGGFAKAFLKRGAGVFVGALWSVGDSPARTFVQDFYLQLKSGSDLATSAMHAREEARTKGDATWLAYVVYGHPSAKLKLIDQ